MTKESLQIQSFTIQPETKLIFHFNVQFSISCNFLQNNTVILTFKINFVYHYIKLNKFFLLKHV